MLLHQSSIFRHEIGFLVAGVNRTILEQLGLHAVSVAVDATGSKLNSRALLFYPQHASRMWAPAEQAAQTTLTCGQPVRFKTQTAQHIQPPEFAGCGILLLRNQEITGALGILVTESFGAAPDEAALRQVISIAEQATAAHEWASAELATA